MTGTPELLRGDTVGGASRATAGRLGVYGAGRSRNAPIMNEAALHAHVVAAIAGDARAYAVFLEGVATTLRPWFRRRLFEGPDQAEDLVQEVLLAIHSKRETYDVTQPVTAWVYAIARYKLIDHLRRVRRRGVHVPVDDVEDLFSVLESGDEAASADVQKLLDHLPEKQRASIRMVKLEQRSVREAAETAGISESDVKISIHRGLKKLAKLVRGES
jgi:RNA polymerase sigma-70 factor (ECF subfamily)